MKKKQKLTASSAAGCKGADDGAGGVELMPLSRDSTNKSTYTNSLSSSGSASNSSASSSSSSSSSDSHGTGKHARNDASDGGDDYYHQTLLPPGKGGLDKGVSGVAACGLGGHG